MSTLTTTFINFFMYLLSILYFCTLPLDMFLSCIMFLSFHCILSVWIHLQIQYKLTSLPSNRICSDFQALRIIDATFIVIVFLWAQTSFLQLHVFPSRTSYIIRVSFSLTSSHFQSRYQTGLWEFPEKRSPPDHLIELNESNHSKTKIHSSSPNQFSVYGKIISHGWRLRF